MLRTPQVIVAMPLTLSLLGLTFLAGRSAGQEDNQSFRSEALQLQRDGNYREALNKFQQLTLETVGVDTLTVAPSVASAVECYQQLNEVHLIDSYLEQVADQYAADWRVLQAIGHAFLGVPHYGYLIAGEFRRGAHRGGGKLVNAFRRDRARALQFLYQSVRLVDQASDSRQDAVANGLLERLAEALLAKSGGQDSWRLQSLTDLIELPEYEDDWGRHSGSEGAAVDADGNPVFFSAPDSWESAANDGERWRWALAARTEWQPRLARQELLDRADFLAAQFGVQTLADYGWFFHGPNDNDDVEMAKYALHTLRDDETIARLATGIRRFELPVEQNHIELLKRASELHVESEVGPWQPAAERLAQVYQNRRQYQQAAAVWRQLVAAERSGRPNAAANLIQIEGNWGRFEPVLAQPAGRGATIDYRYRNGDRVEFTAHAIKVRELLSDVKQYIRQSDGSSEWGHTQIDNLGYRLVTDGQQKYVGQQTAKWSLELEPRANHFDRRVTVTTPLQQPGAYLLTAKMKDGNTHRVVVWLHDTAIVKKPLEDEALYYVADAVTGKPVPHCNVEFFGFRHERRDDGKVATMTSNFAELTDADGLIRFPAVDSNRRLQWLATATTEKGRLAYLGYSRVWIGQRHDAEYKQVKALAITDRPLYRPGQQVQFKFWVRNAQYDMEDESRFANQTFHVEIRDPRNEMVYSESLVADAYGGMAGTWALPVEASLGQYQLLVVNHGGGSFRVEEFKKPEFEVAVVAPKKPVALGEKIAATIKADYYFGSPVINATVKYKIIRTTNVDPWRPPAPWDWLYGPGYGWLGEDYRWYPGWARWGCIRPVPSWIWRAPTPPEVVAEREVAIGPDGQVQLEIDTALAQAMHPNKDHRYEIQAEVVDQSRRTIVGKGFVLATRQPFQVYVWTHRGYYRSGEPMQVSLAARAIDGNPVRGNGNLRLLKVGYENQEPIERELARWDLETDERGNANLQIVAAEPGQYRLSYEFTDADGRQIEGGQIVTVRGEGFDGAAFRFNELELIPDKRHYSPGEKLALQVNVDRADCVVLLFTRPANGVYLPPRVVRMNGKSTVVELDVQQRDMPNFFVEAVAVHDGRLHTVVREIHVPPVRRVINIEAATTAVSYLPGQEAQIQLRLTDEMGAPFVGSIVVAVYDKALQYISGGGNVPEIREFFWKWRREHRPQSETNIGRFEQPVAGSKNEQMQDVGVFGGSVADELRGDSSGDPTEERFAFRDKRVSRSYALGGQANIPMSAYGRLLRATVADEESAVEPAPDSPPLIEPTIRQEFADTALWVASLQTDANGLASVDLQMPENLTTWKVSAWGMGHGTRVGQGSAEVVTRKNLIIRLQTPRFSVEHDEVVISANVHNYLDEPKLARVRLESEGGALTLVGEGVAVDDGPARSPHWSTEQDIVVPAGGERRVDWRVRVDAGGEALVRAIALTDEESDAMQLTFPTLVHGMVKTDSFSGAIRPAETVGGFTFRVPRERRPGQSRLEIHYSPTLAGAMVDALPYLIDYPYGCTEQTLNRFLPAVVTQRTLQRMNLDLAAVQEGRTNLNAQESADSGQREAQWERFDRNPVFDDTELAMIVKTGVNRLTNMQLTDGGWGWFSGAGETSSPHTTAVVVRGLFVARANDVAIVPDVLQRGVQWLADYQRRELEALDNWDRAAGKPVHQSQRAKSAADDIDALIYLVLAEAASAGYAPENPSIVSKESQAAGADDRPGRMREYLYQDRTRLSPYSLAMYGVALHLEEQSDKLAMVMRNLSQLLKQDDENQTAWLDLPAGSWWYWFGSEHEANAYYLKLLAAIQPDSPVAPRLVKYLLNNRKHAGCWNSTRDSALVIEAFADFIDAAGEDKPDLTLEVWIDGQKRKEVAINGDNLLSFDNKLVIAGPDLEPGDHAVEFRKRGLGPIYFNGYLTNFTLEDPIDATGLELKVERRFYRLTPKGDFIDMANGRSQPIGQRIEAYNRSPISNFEEIRSGDLVEVELTVDSKNDYEYVVLEDMKAAGFEPVEVRSGYNGNELGAYVEYRDDRVGLFVRRLMRGSHSVSYRLRAETPGRFSALPTRASAMYAPELKANSNEFKARIIENEVRSELAATQ